MSKITHSEMMEILSAHRYGLAIQCKSRSGSDDWEDYGPSVWPPQNWHDTNYRIKPGQDGIALQFAILERACRTVVLDIDTWLTLSDARPSLPRKDVQEIHDRLREALVKASDAVK